MGQHRFWSGSAPGLIVAMALLVAVALGVAGATRAQAERELRELPAASTAPADVAAAEKDAQEVIPEPPAKGKAWGKALPASAEPPPDVAEFEAERDRQLSDPPGKRSSIAELVEKIRSRPGGPEHLNKANKGERPGKGQVPDQSSWEGAWKLFAELSPLYAGAAHAGETFTLDLTPQVDSSGAHRSLYSSSPLGYVDFFGARAGYWTPNSSNVLISSYSTNIGGITTAVTNPYVSLMVEIPADGWYIVDLNFYASGNVTLKHYEGGSYPTIDTFVSQAGWADYPSILYLAAGKHYFYYFLSRAGNISRVSVDSYP